MRYENAVGKLQYALLFWNNGRQYVKYDDPITQAKVVEKEIRYMQTIGLPTLKYKLKNTTLSAFYYQQFGQDVAGRKVRAFDANAQVSHLLKLDEEKGRSLRLTAGIELMSGTANNATDNINRSFAPLYGTNQAHNGYMDLFFVGGRHEQISGLKDAFLRTRYDFNSRLFIGANTHSFSTYGTVVNEGKELSKNLGMEVDFSLGYLINDAVSVQSGYSQLFASGTFEKLKGVQSLSDIQNWAYVMMIYRPTMKNKFIGLLF